MTNRYLEKIAKKIEEEKAPSPSLGQVVAGYLGGSAAVGTAGQLANEGLRRSYTKDLPSADKSFIQRSDVKDFMRKHDLVGKVKLNGRGGALPYLPPSYIPKSESKAFGINQKIDHIAGIRGKELDSRGFHTLMHELGHAADFHSGNTTLRNHLVTFRGHKARALAGVTGIGMLANDDTRDYAPLVVMPHHLAALREEIAADRNAYKHLKTHGAPGAAKNYLKHRLPAAATYLLAPAVEAGGLYAGGKLADALAKHHAEYEAPEKD